MNFSYTWKDGGAEDSTYAAGVISFIPTGASNVKNAYTRACFNTVPDISDI